MDKLKAVIFDLDETILDRSASLADFLQWQGELLNNYQSLEVSAWSEKFLKLDANGALWKDIVYGELAREFAIRSHSPDELLKQYVHQFHRFCKPRANAVSALHELKQQGYVIGLLSNGRMPFQLHAFQALGIQDLFADVVISGAVGMAKPDPGIFQLACNRLGAAPACCVFVGDNPVADIRGAASVGMYTIYIPGDYFGPRCPTADATCNDFKLLPDLIARLSVLGTT